MPGRCRSPGETDDHGLRAGRQGVESGRAKNIAQVVQNGVYARKLIEESHRNGQQDRPPMARPGEPCHLGAGLIRRGGENVFRVEAEQQPCQAGGNNNSEGRAREHRIFLAIGDQPRSLRGLLPQCKPIGLFSIP